MSEKYALTISEAVQLSGLGRTTLYQLSAAGKLPFKKCGARTIVLAEDLKRVLQALPDAPIHNERGYRKRPTPPLAPPV